MSTDYVFMCKECRKYGGGFTSQAWGTGNADIIDSFRFIMKHNLFCRGEFAVLNKDNGEHENLEPDRDDELLGFFPHSNEWDSEVNDSEYKKYVEYCKR